MTTLALVCADSDLLPSLPSRFSIEVFPEVPSFLERARSGLSSIGVAVLGPATPTPIQVAQRICGRSDDLEVLIVCAHRRRAEMTRLLQLAPFLSPNVRCFEVGPDLAQEIELAVERTNLRRRNQAALQAAQWSLDHAPPPAPSGRIVLEHALQFAPIAVLLATAEGLLVGVNERARELLPEATLGASLPPTLRPFVAPAQDDVAVRRAVVALDDTRRVEVTASHVGPHQPVMLVLQDVSDRLAAEEERRRLAKRIQTAQKLESLADLAGGVAHDFNNLLTTIIGNVELARWQLSAESPALERLSQVELAAEKAADLSRQMLAYAGKGPTALQPIDVNAVVSDTIDILQAAIPKGASLSLALQPGLPTCTVDLAQFRHVVISIVTNASEAIGAGLSAIRISTYARAAAPEDAPAGTSAGPFVVLEVSDDGAGMDEATLARVFDPFFSTKFAGRGLGLAAALGIVRHHHGTIEIESELGVGTTVRAWWPVDHAAPPLASLAPAPVSSGLWSGTILLVDDEPAILSLISVVVQEWGLTVLTAGDGLEALDVYDAHADEIDVVLLDRTMPRLDGSQTFQELRRRSPDVKVIMASGYSEPSLGPHRVGQDGLLGFLQKPFSTAKLKETLAPVFR